MASTEEKGLEGNPDADDEKSEYETPVPANGSEGNVNVNSGAELLPPESDVVLHQKQTKEPGIVQANVEHCQSPKVESKPPETTEGIAIQHTQTKEPDCAPIADGKSIVTNCDPDIETKQLQPSVETVIQSKPTIEPDSVQSVSDGEHNCDPKIENKPFEAAKEIVLDSTPTKVIDCIQEAKEKEHNHDPEIENTLLESSNDMVGHTKQTKKIDSVQSPADKEPNCDPKIETKPIDAEKETTLHSTPSKETDSVHTATDKGHNPNSHDTEVDTKPLDCAKETKTNQTQNNMTNEDRKDNRISPNTDVSDNYQNGSSQVTNGSMSVEGNENINTSDDSTHQMENETPLIEPMTEEEEEKLDNEVFEASKVNTQMSVPTTDTELSIAQKLKNQPPVPTRARGYIADVYDNMSRDSNKPPSPDLENKAVHRAPTIPPRKVGIKSHLSNNIQQPPIPSQPVLHARKKLSDFTPPEPPPRSNTGLATLRRNSEMESKQGAVFDKPHPILSRIVQTNVPETNKKGSIVGRPPPKLPPRPVPVGRSTSQEKLMLEKPSTPDESTKIIIDPVAKEVKRVNMKSSGALSRESSFKKIDEKRASMNLGKLNKSMSKSKMLTQHAKQALSARGSSLDELPDAPPAPVSNEGKKEEKDNAVNNLKEGNMKTKQLVKCESIDMKDMSLTFKKKESSLDAESISTIMTESASCSRANSIRSLKKRNRHMVDRKISNVPSTQWFRSCKAVSAIAFLVGFVGGGVICGVLVFLAKALRQDVDSTMGNTSDVYQSDFADSNRMDSTTKRIVKRAIPDEYSPLHDYPMKTTKSLEQTTEFNEINIRNIEETTKSNDITTSVEETLTPVESTAKSMEGTSDVLKTKATLESTKREDGTTAINDETIAAVDNKISGEATTKEFSITETEINVNKDD